MDLSYILRIIYLFVLFAAWIALSTLINHCVPFYVITIVYAVAFILFFILFSLSLFI